MRVHVEGRRQRGVPHALLRVRPGCAEILEQGAVEVTEAVQPEAFDSGLVLRPVQGVVDRIRIERAPISSQKTNALSPVCSLRSSRIALW